MQHAGVATRRPVRRSALPAQLIRINRICRRSGCADAGGHLAVVATDLCRHFPVRPFACTSHCALCSTGSRPAADEKVQQFQSASLHSSLWHTALRDVGTSLIMFQVRLAMSSFCAWCLTKRYNTNENRPRFGHGSLVMTNVASANHPTISHRSFAGGRDFPIAAVRLLAIVIRGSVQRKI